MPSINHRLTIDPTDPLYVGAPDVAAWLRARTKDDEGREIGNFTEHTRPTVGQVEQAIEQARALVALRVGWSSPESCAPGYVTAVALGAAAIVEKSYFPEQIEARRSAYLELTNEYESAVTSLGQCVSSGGAASSQAGGAVYDVCTPRSDCGEPRPFVPANWNNPSADDPDNPDSDSPATRWLQSRQDLWAGESADAHAAPNYPPPSTP